MGVLAFHLMHGFQERVRSLGNSATRATCLVKNVGVFFAVVVPVLFALIRVDKKVLLQRLTGR